MKARCRCGSYFAG
ncbi:hypothetical protein CLS_36970 [[Clostridium] cf. saccharolyticum K10]|nr:hypothetical protein CLS_36970 [[Clostridium] cf. saccharolyticum K10]